MDWFSTAGSHDEVNLRPRTPRGKGSKTPALLGETND